MSTTQYHHHRTPLTGQQLAALNNALRVAIEVYEHDAHTTDITPRVADQFNRQVAEATELLFVLDQADTVEVIS